MARHGWRVDKALRSPFQQKISCLYGIRCELVNGCKCMSNCRTENKNGGHSEYSQSDVMSCHLTGSASIDLLCEHVTSGWARRATTMTSDLPKRTRVRPTQTHSSQTYMYSNHSSQTYSNALESDQLERTRVRPGLTQGSYLNAPCSCSRVLFQNMSKNTKNNVLEYKYYSSVQYWSSVCFSFFSRKRDFLKAVEGAKPRLWFAV